MERKFGGRTESDRQGKEETDKAKERERERERRRHREGWWGFGGERASERVCMCLCVCEEWKYRAQIKSVCEHNGVATTSIPSVLLGAP